jgi:hypothetical protein
LIKLTYSTPKLGRAQITAALSEFRAKFRPK